MRGDDAENDELNVMEIVRAQVLGVPDQQGTAPNNSLKMAPSVMCVCDLSVKISENPYGSWVLLE